MYLIGAKENLLLLYYTRDQVEKIFELCKQGCKILPLNIETEATFCGHLMITFMYVVTLKLMSDRLKNVPDYSVKFMKMNEAYKAFNV